MAARFRIDWLDNLEFKDWLEEVPSDIHRARCSICYTTFSLSNMGTRALRSHAKGAQHQRRIKAAIQSMSLKCFNTQRSEVQITTVNEATATKQIDMNKFEEKVTTSTDPQVDYLVAPSSSLTPRGLNSFIIKEDVTKAEILWCLHTVVTHKSIRTSEKDVALFEVMFPDSIIAKRMKLRRTKIGYSIMYVGFDESLNKVSQKTQMDINVRFWCNERDNICTRYFTSAFLNRATADEIRNNFKLALAVLNMFSIIQISMDGPNVNHKFFNDLKAELEENSQGDHPVLLNMGSCGLHVLHGAFKTAVKATNWSLINFLRCLHNIFKDVPARRALFIQYSNSSVFPLKFCPVRWLQNGDVAQRALDILPHLKKFIYGIKKDKLKISCASFHTICLLIDDPLLEAKLTFFKSLITEVEPFLEKYQTDVPLVPFLYGSLQTIIVNMMMKFIKENVIKENTSIQKIDLTKKENLLPTSDIDLGFATRSALKRRNKEQKIPDRDILNFRKDCLECIRTFVSKLLERSPLLYPLTKAVTCFDPAIAANNDVNKKRLKCLLTILEEHKWIDGATADRAQREYLSACGQPFVVEELKNYDKNQRIDVFWRDLLKRVTNCDNITKVMKLVMSLFHGNANVERGFSVNSECLVENLKEETLISQRIVYDSIVSTVGDVKSFEIPKSLVHSFKNAYSQLNENMEKRKRESLEKEAVEAERKKSKLIKKELERKMSIIKEHANKEINAIMEQIESLK